MCTIGFPVAEPGTGDGAEKGGADSDCWGERSAMDSDGALKIAADLEATHLDNGLMPERKPPSACAGQSQG